MSWRVRVATYLILFYLQLGECTDAFHSTMVWAIDLDDGTLIDSLGANMGRSKKKVSPEPGLIGQDLGSGWPDEL